MQSRQINRKVRRKVAKKTNVYFESFVAMTKVACEAAGLLHSILHTFDAEKLEEQCREMHEIEHRADQIKHKMMAQLVKEFLPPIEREDISAMGQAIDNVTDSIEDVLMRIYMYDIRALRPEAVQFSELIVQGCEAMHEAMQDFPNYRKSQRIHEAVVRVNSIEEEADRLYLSAGRRLYREHDAQPVMLSAWMRTFDYLEDCCDACEHLADMLETVVLNNS